VPAKDKTGIKNNAIKIKIMSGETPLTITPPPLKTVSSYKFQVPDNNFFNSQNIISFRPESRYERLMKC
jgi:hypothetical protein